MSPEILLRLEPFMKKEEYEKNLKEKLKQSAVKAGSEPSFCLPIQEATILKVNVIHWPAQSPVLKFHRKCIWLSDDQGPYLKTIKSVWLIEHQGPFSKIINSEGA